MSDTEDSAPESAPEPDPVNAEPDPGEIPLETVTANDDLPVSAPTKDSAPTPEPDPVNAEPDPGEIPLETLTFSDEPDPGPITLEEEWRGGGQRGDIERDE